MRPAALTLAGGLLACLANPVALFGYEPADQQPTLAPPQTDGQSIEERLDRMEMQLQLIQWHLGLHLRLPPGTSGADSTLPNPTADDDRLSRIERETRRMDDQLQRLQSQLDGPKPDGRSDVLPAGQGRLVVQNLTGVPHYLSVNKIQYYVLPGRTDIWVPYQVVEAYLPRHEPPKLLGMSLWRWTGRDYEMPLEISLCC